MLPSTGPHLWFGHCCSPIWCRILWIGCICGVGRSTGESVVRGSGFWLSIHWQVGSLGPGVVSHSSFWWRRKQQCKGFWRVGWFLVPHALWWTSAVPLIRPGIGVCFSWWGWPEPLFLIWWCGPMIVSVGISLTLGCQIHGCVFGIAGVQSFLGALG